jgi:hypothetical protein
MNLRSDLDEGRLANLDAVLWARESTIGTGAAAGTRAIDLQVWEGIGCRLYPDRGLDIGQAWWRGVPLAWISGVGETSPLTELGGMAWGAAFGGGLMTTCGLRNVGMPSEGHGLHGTYSHLPAADVGLDRIVADDAAMVVVSGVVDDGGSPAPLRVERTIRSHAGTGLLEIEDSTRNLGDEPAPAPLLYHFNFGFPLWAPPAQLEMPVVSTVARDQDSAVALETWHEPHAVAEGPERVLEHMVAGDDAYGWARLTNARLGLAVTVRWDRAELPRLNQWIDPNPGMAVLGIEPANCTTRGRAYEREMGMLPVLDPGAVRVTRLRVEVEPL